VNLMSALNDTRTLRHLVWTALAALLVLTVIFGGYYIWDRYIHLGDKFPQEENIAHLEQLVRENPQDPEMRLSLAQLYLERRTLSRAIDQSRQILNAYPDRDGALFILGLALIQSEQFEAAIEPLTQFSIIHRASAMAQIDASLEAALYYLGESHLALAQPDQAIPVLLEALTIDRTDADALYQLGVAYAQTGQHEKAIEQLLNTVMFVPDFSEAYNRLAESYTVIGMPENAAYAHGMHAFSVQDYTQARQLLEQVSHKIPDFLPLQVGLGLTYEQLNEFDLARRSFERALEIDGDNFTARHALNRIQQTGIYNQENTIFNVP
jgi:Flp pilus assembly protein TadD